MPLVITINRGILTLRTDSRELSVAQLRILGELFELLSANLPE